MNIELDIRILSTNLLKKFFRLPLIRIVCTPQALHHFRFPKATNILTIFLSHIDDALAVGDNTAQMVKEWCDSGCASKTVRFLKGLLCDMNRGGCVDASEFCGACQERANSFFTQNTLPCCFEKVVQRSIEVN